MPEPRDREETLEEALERAARALKAIRDHLAPKPPGQAAVPGRARHLRIVADDERKAA